MFYRPRFRPVRWLPIILLAGCAPQSSTQDTFLVAAASSLRDVTPELLDSFQPSAAPAATYGASGLLRRQVESGAPIDAVLLASAVDVDRLIDAGLAVESTRTVVAHNRLVLVSRPDIGPVTFETVHTAPSTWKLAIGDPRFVPAGRYAREAFVALGTWEALQERLLFASNVAAVLTYVREGEAELGVVYATEALRTDRVTIVDEALGEWAPEPVVVAVLIDSGNPWADRFVEFLGERGARTVFERYGFSVESHGPH